MLLTCFSCFYMFFKLSHDFAKFENHCLTIFWMYFVIVLWLSVDLWTVLMRFLWFLQVCCMICLCSYDLRHCLMTFCMLLMIVLCLSICYFDLIMIFCRFVFFHLFFSWWSEFAAVFWMCFRFALISFF